MATELRAATEIMEPRSFESAMVLREAHRGIEDCLSVREGSRIRNLRDKLARHFAHNVIDGMREQSPDKDPEPEAIVLIADLRLKAKLDDYFKEVNSLMAAFEGGVGGFSDSGNSFVGELDGLRQIKRAVDARVAALAEDPVYRGIFDATVSTRSAIDEILVAEGTFKQGVARVDSIGVLEEWSAGLDDASRAYFAEYFAKKAEEVKPPEGRKHGLLVRIIHLVHESAKTGQNINFQSSNTFARAVFAFVRNFIKSDEGGLGLEADVAYLKGIRDSTEDVHQIGRLTLNKETIERLLDRYAKYEALGEPEQRRGVAGFFGQSKEFGAWRDAGDNLKNEIRDSGILFGVNTISDMTPVLDFLSDGRDKEFLAAAKNALEKERVQIGRMIEIYEKMQEVLTGDDDYLGKLAAYQKCRKIAEVFSGGKRF